MSKQSTGATPANRRAQVASAVATFILVALLGTTAIQSRISAAQPHRLGSSSVLTTTGGTDSNCIGLVLSVPPDDAPGLVSMVGLYDGSHRRVDGHCVDAKVSEKAAGDAAQALVTGWKTDVDGPQPDVWLPGASTWLVLVKGSAVAGQASLIGEDNPSFAQSPMVIAMPRPMAEALGWPGKPLGFSDLVAIGLDPTGWGAAGHPEWGRLKLGKTSPLISTSGLHALIATYFAATGISADLTTEDLKQADTVRFARGVELATVHYGVSTTAFLTTLQTADQQGKGLDYVSAIALDERQVYLYNQGDPTGDPAKLTGSAKPKYPLAAIYPKEGTLVSDQPFAVLQAPWVTGAKKDAAADLLSWLLQPAQQTALQGLGYRDAQGRPGAQLTTAGGLKPSEPAKVIKLPPSTVLAAVQASWWLIRKPARVLVVVDISGSMDEAVPGTGTTKLGLVKAALAAAIDQVGDSDEIGIWAFSNQHQEAAPLQSVGDHRPNLKQVVASLQPGGGTLLYDTVLDAMSYMRTQLDPGFITAVVVLTDGSDNGSHHTIDQTVSLESTQPVDAAVKVYTIAYGSDADGKILGQIATAAGGTAYDASNPTLIKKVFSAVLSNF